MYVVDTTILALEKYIAPLPPAGRRATGLVGGKPSLKNEAYIEYPVYILSMLPSISRVFLLFHLHQRCLMLFRFNWTHHSHD